MCEIFKFYLLENYIKENKITERQFCKKCFISYRVYKKLKNKDYNIPIDNVEKIANFLCCSESELFY